MTHRKYCLNTTVSRNCQTDYWRCWCHSTDIIFVFCFVLFFGTLYTRLPFVMIRSGVFPAPLKKNFFYVPLRGKASHQCQSHFTQYMEFLQISARATFCFASVRSLTRASLLYFTRPRLLVLADGLDARPTTLRVQRPGREVRVQTESRSLDPHPVSIHSQRGTARAEIKVVSCAGRRELSTVLSFS